MKIQNFTYFYPEKPKLINKNQSLFMKVSNDDNWIAEFKYNGSRLQLHNYDGKYEFWNRHNNPLAFRPTPEIMDSLNSSNLPKGYNLFDGELRHNKVTGVRDKIVLWDCFIYNNQLLYKEQYWARREYVKKHFALDGEYIALIEQILTNFKEEFDKAIELGDEWERIGYDILTEGGMKHIEESEAMSRNEVFNISMDTYAGQNLEKYELISLWRHEDPKFEEDLKMKAFPEENWGW